MVDNQIIKKAEKILNDLIELKKEIKNSIHGFDCETLLELDEIVADIYFKAEELHEYVNHGYDEEERKEVELPFCG